MSDPRRDQLEAALAGVREITLCRKWKERGCDCRVGGETAIQILSALLAEAVAPQPEPQKDEFQDYTRLAELPSVTHGDLPRPATGPSANRFRTKLRLISAEQFFHDKPLPFHYKGPYVGFGCHCVQTGHTRGACTFCGEFWVVTAHGNKVVLHDGDWVIPEPSGPHVIAYAAYPVKPEIFEASYEPDPPVVDPPLAPKKADDENESNLSRREKHP